MSSDGLRLVYQPIPSIKDDNAFKTALDTVTDGTSHVSIASPYLALDVIEYLTEDADFRLVTDEHACFASGCDESFYDFLIEHYDRIRSVHGLHAKVVIGKNAGMFGSANLTRNGLTRRFELSSVVTGATLEELGRWFEALWSIGTPINHDILNKQVAAHRENKKNKKNKGTSELQLPQTGDSAWLNRRKQARQQRRDAAANSSGSAPNAETELSSLAEHVAHHPKTTLPSLAEPRKGHISFTEFNKLAQLLGELTPDVDSALLVLDMLAKALEHTGLAVDDERLHLNFFQKKRRISIAVGQRDIASCSRPNETPEFCVILQDSDLVSHAVTSIEGATVTVFTTNKVTDAYALHVPLTVVRDLDEAVWQEWKQSIDHEVQHAGRSSFLAHKRPNLYHILSDHEARAAVAKLAHPSAWWFGFNNGSSGHMDVEHTEALFNGDPLKWPFGRSKTTPSNAYHKMQPGQKVLLWTGHGRSKTWGILGTAEIGSISTDHLILTNGRRFTSALTPYPRNQVQETTTARFLLDLFDESFVPLGDVRRAIDGTTRTPPMTISPVSDSQFNAIVQRALRTVDHSLRD